ncbi:MAG: tryptophan-rich sensory protein [Clostridia bacterium]|nr:tryptophan-rich sensory protein [Clostridia bacterium]
MWKKIKPYALSVLLALAVGGLSAWITGDNMDIYSQINKPALAPPGILFPIVWGILYVLMGISAACVYVKRQTDPVAAERGLRTYLLSLAVNLLWSPVFFRGRAFLTALLLLVLLWVLILRTVMLYRKVSPAAAYLQLPYLAWVTFAGYLNLSIWVLN